VRDYILGEGSKKERICIFGFEGSHAVPARPSGRGSAYDRNILLLLLLFHYCYVMLSHFIVPVYSRANFVIGPRAVKSAR
jgi:hypothetical protein